MSDDKHLLAFVIMKDHDVLELHADKDGLEYLIRQLQHLRNNLLNDENEHFHMFSEEWGDGTLSNSSMDGEGRPVHQLNAHAWTDEWVEKLQFKRS